MISFLYEMITDLGKCQEKKVKKIQQGEIEVIYRPNH